MLAQVPFVGTQPDPAQAGACQSFTCAGIIAAAPFPWNRAQPGEVTLAVAFENTTRALGADRDRRGAWLLIGVCALLAAWAAWFVLARVPVYQVAEVAALEGITAAHPVTAELEGRVTAARLELGRVVAAGEALVELDARPVRLLLDESQARLAGLRAEIASLDKESAGEQAALEAQRRATQASLAEAQARLAEAAPRARFAEEQLVNRRSLQARKFIGEEGLRQAESQAESARAAVDALALARAKLERDAALEAADRQTRLARLRSDRAQLQSQAAEAEARIRRLEHELTLYQVRAPVTGRLGQVSTLKPGAMVRSGEVLAAIVPEGAPRAVAFFPVAAVGRLAPGQPARLRLHGFPWLSFGLPRATVAAVGNESVDGRVRVELALLPESAPRIPLQHGLAGSVEVEIERVSPLELVLRAAGKLLEPQPLAIARP